MHRDNVGSLVGIVDGVRTVDAQRIQVTGIRFVVGIEIFTDMDVIVDQGEAGVGPDAKSFYLGIDQRTVLVQVVERKKESRFSVRTANGYIMALHGSRFKDVFEPIVAIQIGQRYMIGIQII